jgi:hypothetical protein
MRIRIQAGAFIDTGYTIPVLHRVVIIPENLFDSYPGVIINKVLKGRYSGPLNQSLLFSFYHAYIIIKAEH